MECRSPATPRSDGEIKTGTPATGAVPCRRFRCRNAIGGFIQNGQIVSGHRQRPIRRGQRDRQSWFPFSFRNRGACRAASAIVTLHRWIWRFLDGGLAESRDTPAAASPTRSLINSMEQRLRNPARNNFPKPAPTLRESRDSRSQSRCDPSFFPDGTAGFMSVNSVTSPR